MGGESKRYCTRNHSRPSKSVADHDLTLVKPQSNIHVDSSCPSKYVKQLHPTRSENTQNDTTVQKAKEWYKHDFCGECFDGINESLEVKWKETLLKR
ncbi:uncharacterized protein LOC141720798 [Apium graveolens]|uniref:uncharacterized protein LOC141720798 n=1 Tax=Apium graveolens TaxID=4045 RepID=UPI003D78F5E5